MILLWGLESEDKDWNKSEHSFFLLSVYYDSGDILGHQYVLA